MDPEINVEVVSPPPAPVAAPVVDAVEAIATAAALIDTAGNASAEKVERTVADLWNVVDSRFNTMWDKLQEIHADVRALQIAEIVEEEQAAQIEEAVEEAVEEVAEVQELVKEEIPAVAEAVEQVPEKIEQQKRTRRWI